MLIDPLKVLSNPWKSQFFCALSAITAGSVLVACVRSGGAISLPAISTTIGVLTGAIGWHFLSKRTVVTTVAMSTIVAACVVSLLGLVQVHAPLWIHAVVSISYLMLAASLRADSGTGRVIYLFLPIAFGGLVLGIAASTGKESAGGFPAAYVVLLSIVALATRKMEVASHVSQSDDAGANFYKYNRRKFALLSVVFFVFGVVTLWPWLGKIYGFGYLWILLAGVILPTMYFWGRLRQPRGDNPLLALERFNRIIPYTFLLLFIAIAVG